MTAEERTDKLEERVTRIENDLWAELKEIRAKIEALIVRSAKNECPSPGACVSLGQKVDWITLSHDATMKRVERLELEIIRLGKRESWILGAAAVVSIIGSFAGSLLIGLLFYWLKK